MYLSLKGFLFEKILCNTREYLQLCYHADISLNECDGGTDDCDVNADCADTDGGFICTCREGYSGNGTSCASEIFSEWLHTCTLECPIHTIIDIKQCSEGVDDYITMYVSLFRCLKSKKVRCILACKSLVPWLF